MDRVKSIKSSLIIVLLNCGVKMCTNSKVVFILLRGNKEQYSIHHKSYNWTFYTRRYMKCYSINTEIEKQSMSFKDTGKQNYEWNIKHLNNPPHRSSINFFFKVVLFIALIFSAIT